MGKIRIENEKVVLTKNLIELLDKIEDKDTREFRKNMMTETMRRINLNSKILSYMTSRSRRYEYYNNRLLESKNALKIQEGYLMQVII